MDNKPGYVQGDHPKSIASFWEESPVRDSEMVWSLPVISVPRGIPIEVTPEIQKIIGKHANAYDMAVAAGKAETMKASNPKQAFGDAKLPLHLWPETVSALGSLALLDGALKYGRSNFRAIGVKASTYFSACRRHLNFWFEGEDLDPDSNLPHLAHALACLAILVEAQAAGNLTDDRMFQTNFREWMDSLTPNVARLKEVHKDKQPKHYTIEDSK